MSEFHLRSRYIRAAKHSQSIEAVYVHSMHFLAISVERIRTALLSLSLPSLLLCLGNARSPKLSLRRLNAKPDPQTKRQNIKGKTDGADPCPKNKKNKKRIKKEGRWVIVIYF